MQIKVKKLHPEAIIPEYQAGGDAACFDLHTVEAGQLGSSHWRGVFSTGLAFEIPKGYVMLVFGRSGHAFNHDISLANCVGVIDPGYRGEVLVKLTMKYVARRDFFYIKEGDRIAQAMVMPVPWVQFEVAEELPNSQRGSGGFGSTGV